MKTTDLFKSNRSAKRLNESLEKTFGTKINFQDFDTPKLEDARNKLRTQIHDARSQSGFNETIENETLTKAQWMHDAIVSELAEREEYIVDTTTDENYESMWADADIEEGSGIDRKELMDILKRFDENMNEIGGYGDPDFDKILAALNQGDVESAVEEVYGNYSDQDGGELRNMDDYIEDLEYEFKDLVGGSDDEGGETDDGYALASAGFGSDEDYESVNNEGGREMTGTARDRFISTMTPRMDNDALMQKVAKVVNSPEFTEDTILKIVDAGNTVTHPVARYIQKEFDELQYDLGRQYEDYPERVAEKLLSMLIARTKKSVGEDVTMERDRDPEDWDEGNTEPPNNFAVSINGKQWKVFKGRGYYADDDREKQHYRQLKDWAAKKSESTGKKWTVSITGENPTESIQTEKNQSSLDSTRDRLRSQGLGSPRSSNDSDRWEKEKDSRTDYTLNSIANRSKEDNARTQHEIDVLATRLKRMDRDDDDWKKTFDMMRDRINRYQWSSQRDVDPEQLGKISDIKYDPRKKNEAASATESMGGATDSKGRTQREWLSLVKAKFPDAKIQQAKMIDGPVQVTLPDGRKLGWSKAEKQNAMPRPAEANGKLKKDKKEDMNTNEAYINNARDAINLLADIRKQSKMAELGQGDPVRPNQLVNDLYDVMQWIENNMDEVIETESVENSGENMTKLREGEIQQASAIVTAKTMVDRVGRWIEELSGMENDTLLQLGDSIRDEMGQEQSKAFIQAVAPAIQQALETLKGTRDTLSTGVRSLASGEQPADMLGAEPDAMGGDEMAAEPDAMNMGDDMGGEDEFAAAEPAAGGLGDAGREQRESINRSSSLLKVLAG